MADIATLSPTALMRRIGTAQTPVIIDVSIDEDVAEDPFLVPTARRHDHFNIDRLATDLKQKSTVIICQKGRKLSQGAAALLRGRGVTACALEGGNHAWRAAGLPRVPLALLPEMGAPGRWVTAADPGMDALACAWLIRRFLTPEADILFVPPADVPDVAEKFGAIPFGPDHMDFGAIAQRYGLETPALRGLAGMIASAAARPTGAETPVLQALATGLRHAAAEGSARLAAALPLWDALYLWARDDAPREVAA